MEQSITFHDLRGSSVFITGGGAGIGAALTEGFIQQGAKVSFVQRSEARAFCDEMQARYGERPHFIQCDVSEIDMLRVAMVQAATKNGPITTLINNAAVDNRHTLQDYAVDDWNEAMNINLRPYFFTAQAVSSGMKAGGGGSIINLSSIAYLMGDDSFPAYVTAKAAITGLTRALARELGPDNIRVNALLPGWVMTERQQALWATPEKLELHLERQCIKDTLLPDDIVPTVLFLASNASRMMTGQAVVVDGGVVVTG